MDEMSIKPCLTYDRKTDKIIGFEDLGGNARHPKIANNVLTFMIRGITSNWKQPIGYIMSSGPCKAAHVRTLLLKVLEEIASVGLEIKAIISDQGSNFLQLYKSLGVTDSSPYFEVSEKQYFIMFDPPHLLKSIRNNFFKYNVEFGNYAASWDDIVKMHSIDSKNMFRCARKITE